MTQKRERKFKTFKQQGEWTQLLFMARAAEIGLAVSQPYGDSASYDVGIERGGRLLRVQVKSVTYQREGGFTCNVVGPGHSRYRRGLVDLFAIYLIPMDLWYIIPYAAVGGTSLLFAPEMKGQKYQRYIEAWYLLRGEARGR
jgi:hypothetical protein